MEKRKTGRREAPLRLPDARIKEGILSLEGMRFNAFHGCFEKERKEGGEFLVDLHLRCGTAACIQSDALEDTVDLQEVYRAVRDEMSVPSRLIEHAAARILDAVCALPGVLGAEVKLSKCHPPLEGPCHASSVTLCR